jgi:hypothetical protein
MIKFSWKSPAQRKFDSKTFTLNLDFKGTLAQDFSSSYKRIIAA